MKKITLFATACLMLVAATVSANDGTKKTTDNTVVTGKVKSAFEQDFKSATATQWNKVGGFYFASFMQNGEFTEVAYNESGELVGTAQKLNTNDLPFALTENLASKYAGYALPETATEINLDGETRYCFNISNATETLRIKCNPGGYIEVEERIKK